MPDYALITVRSARFSNPKLLGVKSGRLGSLARRRRRERAEPRIRVHTMGDRDRGGQRTSEFMELNNASTAFLLGKEGATKNRLSDFTGCTLEIGHSKVGPSQHTL